MSKSFIGYEVSRSLVTQRLLQGILQYVLLGVQWIVALALFPRYLGAEGMGIFSLILATRGILWPLLSLNLRSGCALHVASMEDKEAIRRRFYSSFYFSVASALLLSAVILAVGAGFYPARYIGLMLLLTLVSIVQDFGTMPAQAHQKTGFLATYTCIVEYGSMSLGLLLAYLGYGPEGVIAGWIICYALGSIFLHTMVARDIGLFKSIDFGILKSYVVFSMPLLIMAMSQKGMETADRYLLAVFKGTEQVGVYSVAYFIGTPFLALVVAISFVWYGTIAKLWLQDRLQFHRVVTAATRYAAAALVVVLVLVYLLSSPSLVGALAGDSFKAAAGAVPVVALAYAFFLFGTLFSNMLLVVKKPLLVMLPFVVALAISILLNFLLIPHFGIMGAAVATASAYGVYLCLTIKLACAKCGLKLEAGPFISVAAVGIIGVMLAWVAKTLGVLSVYTAAPMAMALMAITLGSLVLTKVISIKGMKEEMKRVVRSAFPRRKR